MGNNQKIKKLLFIIFFMAVWGLMLIKTLFVSLNEPESFFSPFYSVMLESTWQSHFNVDLFLFTLIFAAWVIYREKYLLLGIIVGVFSIILGGVFAFFYLLICAMNSKGDIELFINGSKAGLSNATNNQS